MQVKVNGKRVTHWMKQIIASGVPMHAVKLRKRYKSVLRDELKKQTNHACMSRAIYVYALQKKNEEETMA